MLACMILTALSILSHSIPSYLGLPSPSRPTDPLIIVITDSPTILQIHDTNRERKAREGKERPPPRQPVADDEGGRPQKSNSNNTNTDTTILLVIHNSRRKTRRTGTNNPGEIKIIRCGAFFLGYPDEEGGGGTRVMA